MAHLFAPTLKEISPVLGLFGPFAGRMSELFRLEKTLSYQFSLCPPRMIHVAAIYLHHEAERDTPPSVTANTLLTEHPRDLLRSVFSDYDPRLYRLLDRAALPAWSQSDYAALNDVLQTEVADLLLNRGEITPLVVNHAQGILHADPIIRRARHAVPHEQERRRLETLIAVLRRLDMLHDLDAIPDGAGRQAVAKRAAADLGRLEPSGDVEFPIPQQWVRVQNLQNLWRIANSARFCIRPGQWGAGDYALSFLMDRSIFLYHPEPPGLLAQFREMVAGFWVLAQCKGAGNRPAPRSIVRELTNYVEQAGVSLLPDSLGDAMDTVLSPLRTRDRDDEGGHHELFDDDLDELAA